MRVLFISLSLLFAFACQPSNYEGNGKTIEKVDPTVFQQVISQGGLLIDVRTPDEYAEGHLEGSTNLDFLEMDFVDHINELDTLKIVMVYCRSGGRSKSAAKILRTAGFSKVYDLEGGIGSWEEAGLATVK